MRGCAPLTVGIIVGKLTMLTAAIVGIAALVATLGPIFTVVQYVGAAYLLYLGIRKWRRAKNAAAEGAVPERGGVGTQMALGLGLTLSNPIAIAFYLALLPGVVDVARITVGTYLILVAIIVAVMLVTVTVYGVIAEVARRIFTGSRAKVWMDRLSGSMFVAAGLWVALRPLL
ncbi:LysE family translocator [Micromonospora sp. NPDC049559]|uniref:LysE family translocator n=1 Tax=Micromonospora sp. NPDC049559 TaxID=3155923 RepID=UPI00343266BB